MRLIGQLDREDLARKLGDYLFVKGIDNQIEQDPGSGWGVWIHDEDKLQDAASILSEFRANPDNPRYLIEAKAASAIRSDRAKAEAAYRKKFFKRGQIFRSGTVHRFGAVTFTLIVVSVSIFVLTRFGSSFEPAKALFISERFSGLMEIRSGQIWRLITPIFIHMNFLHIFFNMLWMMDLGRMVESHRGVRSYLVLVLSIAIVSNLAQYFLAGPAFGGMSGVVYGLLGYVWFQGKFNPASGFFLHPSTVIMMLVWLGLGFIPGLGMRMANGAHVMGLVAGIIWGALHTRR